MQPIFEYLKRRSKQSYVPVLTMNSTPEDFKTALVHCGLTLVVNDNQYHKLRPGELVERHTWLMDKEYVLILQFYLMDEWFKIEFVENRKGTYVLDSIMTHKTGLTSDSNVINDILTELNNMVDKIS